MTKYLVFGSKANLLTHIAPILLNDIPIERVYEARNLGLYRDSELRFGNHVSKTIKTSF